MSEDGASDRERARRLADEIIDYAVYAPLGAAITIADQFPDLVRRGRERFSSQISLAQVVGRVAVDQARRQAEGFVRGPNRVRTAAPNATPEAEGDPDLDAVSKVLPDYGARGAADLVGALSGLTREELEMVRSYESGHRARRTILGRIDQLLKNSSA